ncbi:MAG: hypothetical protein DWQ47_10045 [Acidobacteria bacterium]|nr:MAG: hypothetical protein DWQ32_12460 [Acidobacteriota bacterium]REJ98669.1 MAG: hypothetical protein DWQ38_15020 [Acidobacteriota bacterium]REK16675.1 MAG: hypothetical protein DWQ43_00305 [Acidobacteriota bacterium]REK42586.1 MAG: hypothetical protein DWQ47_10045 [Acidobacteriota bacterium]
MTKAKLFIAIAIAFIFVSNTFALSTTKLSQVDRSSEIAELSRSMAAGGVKTNLGTSSFALSSEFEWTKIYIFLSAKDEKYGPMLAESLDYLQEYLSGSEEEMIIDKTINTPGFTFEDLLNSVIAAERSIYSRLSGESRWAFDLAKVLTDVGLTAYPEAKDDLVVYLMALEVMAEEGNAYASAEEVQMLKDIAGLAKKDNLNDEDFESVRQKVSEFITVYMTTM